MKLLFTRPAPAICELLHADAREGRQARSQPARPRLVTFPTITRAGRVFRDKNPTNDHRLFPATSHDRRSQGSTTPYRTIHSRIARVEICRNERRLVAPPHRATIIHRNHSPRIDGSYGILVRTDRLHDLYGKLTAGSWNRECIQLQYPACSGGKGSTTAGDCRITTLPCRLVRALGSFGPPGYEPRAYISRSHPQAIRLMPSRSALSLHVHPIR